eukprot:6208114-Pleurochrysis_carterae.AAC.2
MPGSYGASLRVGKGPLKLLRCFADGRQQGELAFVYELFAGKQKPDRGVNRSQLAAYEESEDEAVGSERGVYGVNGQAMMRVTVTARGRGGARAWCWRPWRRDPGRTRYDRSPARYR